MIVAENLKMLGEFVAAFIGRDVLREQFRPIENRGEPLARCALKREISCFDIVL